MFGKKEKQQRLVSVGNIEKRKKEGWKEVKDADKQYKLDGTVDAVLMEK